MCCKVHLILGINIKAISLSSKSFCRYIVNIKTLFLSLQVWTIVIGYLLVVIFFWTPDCKRFLRYISVPIWFILILHTATHAGYFRVPLFIFLLVLILIGFAVEVNAARQQIQTEGNQTSNFKNFLFSIQYFNNTKV